MKDKSTPIPESVFPDISTKAFCVASMISPRLKFKFPLSALTFPYSIRFVEVLPYPSVCILAHDPLDLAFLSKPLRICAAVNSVSEATSPWPTSDKSEAVTLYVYPSCNMQSLSEDLIEKPDVTVVLTVPVKPGIVRS